MPQAGVGLGAIADHGQERRAEAPFIAIVGDLGIVVQRAIAEVAPIVVGHHRPIEGIVGEGQHAIQVLKLFVRPRVVADQALIEHGHVARVCQHDLPAFAIQRLEPVRLEIIEKAAADGQPLLAKAVGDLGTGVHPPQHQHQGIAGVHPHVQTADGGGVVLGPGVLQQPVGDQRNDGQIQVFYICGGQQRLAEGDELVGLGFGKLSVGKQYGEKLGVQEGPVFGGEIADADEVFPQQIAVQLGVVNALQGWRRQLAYPFQPRDIARVGMIHIFGHGDNPFSFVVDFGKPFDTSIF